MNEPPYPFLVSDDSLNYRFESVGELKVVDKAISFRPFAENPIFYNLALVDVVGDRVDDLVITNNQDISRVMATVFRAMLVFFKKYPNKLVYFKGSDESGVRSRLYRILIARELEKISELFDIYGQVSGNSYEKFALDRPYVGFIFQLKP